jgi:hypothetical protein
MPHLQGCIAWREDALPLEVIKADHIQHAGERSTASNVRLVCSRMDAHHPHNAHRSCEAAHLEHGEVHDYRESTRRGRGSRDARCIAGLCPASRCRRQGSAGWCSRSFRRRPRARSGGASDRTPRAVGASRPRPSEFVRRSYGRRTGQSHARVHGEFQKIFANHLGQHGDPGASILYGCTWPDGMTPASLNEPRWSMSRSIGIGTCSRS